MKNIFKFAFFSFGFIPYFAYGEGAFQPDFFSADGVEAQVHFQASFQTDYTELDQVNALTLEQREYFKVSKLEPTMKYLFGPLTNRGLASPQRGSEFKVDWTSATISRGKVFISYQYSGIWIIKKSMVAGFSIPVPMNNRMVYSSQWKKCSDSDPEHQTESFYWYFWDPARSGCDQKLGVHYQTVNVVVGSSTANTTASYPEFDKLIKGGNQHNQLQMTFGFGYVNDPADPMPDTDYDSGILEYRSFISYMRATWGSFLQETPILQGEYQNVSDSEKIIGRRFQGEFHGQKVLVNIVAAAGVDQMDIFAKSFAHDHDSFFAWLGHSRVGSGFDAEKFGYMLDNNPNFYSVTPSYQLVYWGGCNSYSYYTLPFFDFKAKAANGSDPKGTKGLDIIANGLPSYFSLNSKNGVTMMNHLMNWEKRPSYQTIVSELEASAGAYGIDVLVAVLGDEDNT